MKKYLWPAIIVVILILAVVFYYLGQSGKTSDQSSSTSIPKTESGNLFTSIKDAMSKSLSLKCEYQVEGIKTTTYIKGDMLRITTEAADAETGNGNAIVKDNKMWIWTEGEDEGFLIELTQEDVVVEEQEAKTASDTTSREDVIKEIEKYKDSCSQAVVADSMFNPPADVTFSDLSKFQEQLMEEINGENIPLEEVIED